MQTYTSEEAATELGICQSYVRRLCLNSRRNGGGPEIGRKHNRDWMLTPGDLRRIRQTPGFGTRRPKGTPS